MTNGPSVNVKLGTIFHLGESSLVRREEAYFKGEKWPEVQASQRLFVFMCKIVKRPSVSTKGNYG